MAFFNPFRPGYLENPYPLLARLRAEEPVHWSAEVDAWVVTSYVGCLAALHDDETFSSDPGAIASAFGEEVRRKRAAAPLGRAPIMGNSDPPMHTRLRAVVNRGFTPRVVEAMRAPIERAVEAILEEIPAEAPFDAISSLAEPLAVSVVLEHLGIPRHDFGEFRKWSLALMRGRAEGETPGALEDARSAEGEMFDYLARLAERRDAGSHEGPFDVFSVLLGACDEEAIEPAEMLMMLIHISLAGNGPTAMALGNALAVLAANPAALEALRRDPRSIPQAVEELLRFDSSTHFVVRFAKDDATLGTRTIRAGQQLHLMVGAANRDPARFANPDTLDLAREDNRHLSFGYGIHFCLGAPLARLELQVALQRFIERFGAFEVLRSVRMPNYQLRGFQALELRAESR